MTGWILGLLALGAIGAMAYIRLAPSDPARWHVDLAAGGLPSFAHVFCIRPGTPNKAASGFFSNILREPLAGLPAVMPVPDTTRHWFASPRAALGFFHHAAAMDLTRLGAARALNMPGLSATVAEEIEALRRVAGQGAVDLIRVEHDPAIAAIVANWPENFDTARATALGFAAETSFDQIIAQHIQDEAVRS